MIFKFNFGNDYFFINSDKYLGNVIVDIPEVTVEYGVEVWPEPTVVTPPSVTVDPDAFAIKIPAQNDLSLIQGRVVIDGM